MYKYDPDLHFNHKTPRITKDQAYLIDYYGLVSLGEGFKMNFKVPEEYRITTGAFASDVTCGNNGAFLINNFYCIASDGMDWEHVSVSLQDGHRLPTHYDMERIKALFWSEDSYVIEIHPPKSEYVNNGPVLHLWRPTKEKLPVPPSVLVGLK